MMQVDVTCVPKDLWERRSAFSCAIASVVCDDTTLMSRLRSMYRSPSCATQGSVTAISLRVEPQYAGHQQRGMRAVLKPQAHPAGLMRALVCFVTCGICGEVTCSQADERASGSMVCSWHPGVVPRAPACHTLEGTLKPARLRGRSLLAATARTRGRDQSADAGSQGSWAGPHTGTTSAASSSRRRSRAPMFCRYSRRIASSTRTCSSLRCSDRICVGQDSCQGDGATDGKKYDTNRNVLAG